LDLGRLAEVPDIFMLVVILAGVVYPTLVFTGHKTGLASLLPSVFTPRVGAVAMSSLMFGLGLVVAGAKYGALDPPSARFFSIAGWSLIVLAAFIWIRRSD
jgi:hypothetical protein